MNADSALLYFESFIKMIDDYQNVDLSETDTRSKLIDHMFINILGWNEKNIQREGYVKPGYYDYLFAIPGFQFIVEAKRTFVEFSLPKKNSVVTLATLEKGNSDVISQARMYLLEKGLQYSVITNGKQYIIGKLINSDGSDWRKNKCIVFNGVDDIRQRFIDFYNLLSFTSVVENGGFESQINVSIPKGKKIISTIPHKDSELVRNSLSAKLTPIIDEIFGELFNYNELSNEELIKECFIENVEIRKNKSDIERFFADTPPAVENIIKARNTASISSQIQGEISNHPIKIDIDAPRPIIIVGSKGAGKSTFINYLFKNDYDDNVMRNHPYIYIDFRKYSSGDFSITKKHILNNILEQVFEKYEHLKLDTLNALKGIFRKEIKRNDKNIWLTVKENNPEKYEEMVTAYIEEQIKDEENYLYKLSEYLVKERQTRLCIIIDNADQFDINIQRDVFLFAQTLNLSAKSSIIISLREGYFYKFRYSPPFDAFNYNVYHITAPQYKEVLQKRINYALKHLEQPGKSYGAIKTGTKIQISNDAVVNFFLSLKTSLFGRDNIEMMQFLEETTYPNIREGLQVFKNFLLSGHTEVDQYIVRQQVSPDSKTPIPFWEFVKAVALNNKKYYSENISIVCNLFNPAEGQSNHFLKIKILKFLNDKLFSGGQSEKFVSLDHIITTFTEAGYNLRNLRDELELLKSSRLIETDDVVSDINESDTINDNKSICISLKGHYYVNKLKNRLSYIELVLQDTLIFSEGAFNTIRSVFPLSDDSGKRNLADRLKTVNAFMDYLKEQEKLETIESENIAKGIVDEIFSNGLSRDIKGIERRLTST